VVTYTMVCNVVITVQFQMQDHSFRSAQWDEIFSKCSDKFIRIVDQIFGEAVHTEVDGSQVLDNWIVSKDTDVGSWSEC